MTMEPEWILFDCMETLIDMEPIPQSSDYAAWAFFGSGVEGVWHDFEQFHTLFEAVMDLLSKEKPGYMEWSSLDRFTAICSNTPGMMPEQVASTADCLQHRFFTTYCSKCFVHEDVIETVPLLAADYKLGVVSNFKVEKGIEALLERYDLLRHFQWVVCSCDIGWRKPHPSVYQCALKRTRTTANNVLFVGDDPENDISAPLTFGMSTLLLDRHQRRSNIDYCEKISDFYQLRQKLSAG